MASLPFELLLQGPVDSSAAAEALYSVWNMGDPRVTTTESSSFQTTETV
jgi:hypothetical protein